MPASPGRDLLLLGALMLAGYQLGAFLDNGGAGLACGVLAYLLISYRRMAQLQRWLAEGPLKRDPPVQGGMLGDVADRMQHTHALLQKQLDEADATVARLRESYAALKDGIVMLGPDNAIEWANASALALLGLRYPQDVGQALGNLVRDPDFAAYLAQADFERSFELETGGAAARTLEVQATSFGANRKVVFVRDITGLKRLETMRRDFVANISHELRTPLTVIAGYVDVLQDLLPQDSPVIAKALGQMQQQSVRMEHLLRDLMLLSTLEGTEHDDASAEESIAVCAMLDSIRENALAACGGERHITLRVRAGPAAARTAAADREHLLEPGVQRGEIHRRGRQYPHRVRGKRRACAAARHRRRYRHRSRAHPAAHRALLPRRQEPLGRERRHRARARHRQACAQARAGGVADREPPGRRQHLQLPLPAAAPEWRDARLIRAVMETSQKIHNIAARPTQTR